MSLADPNDDYDELVPRGAGKVKKAVRKARIYVAVLLIGLVLGAYLQYAYLNPIVASAQLGSCSGCITARELLNKENACLYSLLPNPNNATEQCRQALAPPADNPPQTMPASPDGNTNPPDLNMGKGFNEEAPQP